jgi:hypothetical protein
MCAGEGPAPLPQMDTSQMHLNLGSYQGTGFSRAVRCFFMWALAPVEGPFLVWVEQVFMSGPKAAVQQSRQGRFAVARRFDGGK